MKRLIFLLGAGALFIGAWCFLRTDTAKTLYDTVRPQIFGRRTVDDALRAYEKGALARLRADGALPPDGATPARLLLFADKGARLLTVYGADAAGKNWRALKAYPFRGFSGKTGPKLREGDRQIPEGVYAVAALNPNSRFHLALRLDYPNAFDRARAARDGRPAHALGGDIMIHGRNNTVGCIPMGDEAIEEIFTLAARAGIENVSVLAVPCDPRTDPMPRGDDLPPWYPELWESLRAQAQLLPQAR